MITSRGSDKLKMFGPAKLQRYTFTIVTTILVSLCLFSTASSQSPECRFEPLPGSDGNFAVGDSVNLCCGIPGTINVTCFNGEKKLACPEPNVTCCPLELAPEDNGVDFTCTVLTSSSDEPRNYSFMPLRILPNVTIRQAGPGVNDEVGSYAVVECYGVGVPGIANYSWTATHSESGEIIPPENYTLLADGRVMVMTVQASFVVSCTVKVPSGLSNNSSLTVEAIEPAVSPVESCQWIFLFAAVLAVQVALMGVVLAHLLYLRKRMRKRKSMTPRRDKPNAEQAADTECVYANGNQDNGYAMVDEDGDSRAGEYEDVSVEEGMMIDHSRNTSIVSEYLDLHDPPANNSGQEYAYAEFANTTGGGRETSRDTTIISEYLELQDTPGGREKENGHQVVECPSKRKITAESEYEKVSIECHIV
ncbi:uncharacterized protein LOC110977251 isoform X2 [Acanthaster planci]|uniref:Uncharacterized protein LOC110977251 isoform X2 n=1 Tax=Acanthaster planci TaxID=133434 RepID=A0A8B7Y149_ACAPL|nr:uncharacterized protein LOC110977251 isoform X2 [Acanthaster planci]